MSAAGRGNAFSGEYGMSGKHAYPNNRTTTDNGDYFGAIGSSVGAVVAPLLDILRPSRKQNTIGSLRPYQNPKSEVNATYVFDPNDKPNPTIRETTENSVFHLNMDRGQHGDGYQVTPHQLLHTARTTTDDFYYSGTGVGPREMRNYDAEYNQRNNEIKSSTIEGRMVPGNMSLLNADINMRTKTLDHDLKNTRQMQPTMPYQSPNVESMGHTMNNTRLYANMGLDRNQPDMLSALNSNPYAQNIMNLYGGMNAK
jgi:hypothetical protein